MHQGPQAKAAPDLAALAPLIEQHGLPTRLLAKGFENMFNSLARNIVGQQLAVKAAKVISGRFLTLCQASCQASVVNMQEEVFLLALQLQAQSSIGTDCVAMSVYQVLLSDTVLKCAATRSHATSQCLCLVVMQTPSER